MTPTPLFLFGKAWMEEPDRLWSMGSWKVGHDWATNHTCMCQADSFSQKEHETDDARIESLVQEASCFFSALLLQNTHLGLNGWISQYLVAISRKSNLNGLQQEKIKKKRKGGEIYCLCICKVHGQSGIRHGLIQNSNQVIRIYLLAISSEWTLFLVLAYFITTVRPGENGFLKSTELCLNGTVCSDLSGGGVRERTCWLNQSTACFPSLESLESRGIITPLEAYMGGSFIGLHRGKAVTPRRLPQEQERIWVGKTTIVHHSGHSSGV